MVLSIILGAPLWVWPLLAFLMWIGLRAARPRVVSVLAVYTLPLIGVMGLGALLRSAPESSVWIVYALAYGTGATLGFRLQRRWVVRREERRVHLRGEWLTLSVVLTLFFTSYAWNVLAVFRPDFAESTTLLRGLAMLFGLLSGSFAGRALRVLFLKESRVV